MDKPQVFDQQGQERDWSWLVENFGAVALERAEVEGEISQVYRIVELRDTEGPAVQIVTVMDQQGNPLEGIRVARYWPDAPQLPAWPPPVSRWRTQGVFGPTNAQGKIGFGMGGGDYYFPSEVGASAIWVAHAAGPADLISGLGMIGLTNHRRLDIVYQLQTVEQAPHPPEPPSPTTPDEWWDQLFERLDAIIALLESRLE